MPGNKSFSSKKYILLTFVGLIVFVAYLYFFVGFAEIQGVLRDVDLADYLLFYSLAVVALVMSLFFYSMAWHELLKLLSTRIILRKVFLYCWLGNFVDLVVPFETVTGEIARVYLAFRNSSGHLGKIIASVATQRIISMVMVLGGLVVSSATIILRYRVEQFVLGFLMIVQVGTVGSLLLIFYFSVRKESSQRLVNSLLKMVGFLSRGRLDMSDVRIKAYRTLLSFYEGVETIGGQPGRLVKPLVFNFVAWLLHSSVYILVFYALGFKELALDVSIAVYSISVAVQTIPIGLSVGLVEIVMANIYGLLGVPLALASTATALIRLITFWLQILVGYIMAQYVGFKDLTQREVEEM